MIRLASVSKSYRKGTIPVLKNLSLSVGPKELVMIVGRSGSGKSTLLNLLSGLDFADSGNVEVYGMTLARSARPEELARFRLTQVGIVFQFFNLLPTLSLLENVAIPGYLSGLAGRAARARAAELLDEVSLSYAADRFPHEASGGEMQRAAIARALVNNPRLIVADEPTGNLDEENGAAVLRIFRSLADKGISVVTVTHDSTLLLEADRVLQLHGGALHSGTAGV